MKERILKINKALKCQRIQKCRTNLSVQRNLKFLLVCHCFPGSNRNIFKNHIPKRFRRTQNSKNTDTSPGLTFAESCCKDNNSISQHRDTQHAKDILFFYLRDVNILFVLRKDQQKVDKQRKERRYGSINTQKRADVKVGTDESEYVGIWT